jgi:2-methylcitrate dehydratase PrpD
VIPITLRIDFVAGPGARPYSAVGGRKPRFEGQSGRNWAAMEGAMTDAGPATGLTEFLAARAASLSWNDIPEPARAVARQCVLDYLGAAIAGAAEPLGRILLDEMRDAGGAPQASLIGHAAALPALAAALINGAAAHALDYDDVNVAIPGHPSVAILPGLLALAERERASGRDVSTAFVAGYETACRIGIALQPGHYHLGFHATGTIGSLGAAAACARLLGLSATASAAALGIAATQAAGLKAQFGTMCKPFHAGRAAQNGLLAARLAARGFTSRDDILECAQGFAATHGPDFSAEAARTAPANGWHILANLFKYHAACYFTHAPIECARELRRAYALAPEAIAQITLRIDAGTDRVCNIPDPADGLQSKFSLRQTVAMALAGIDTASLGAYSEANARDPLLVRLREKLILDFRSGWPPTRAEMEIALTDGRRVAASHDSGIPADDIAAQGRRLAVKFDALVEPVLGAPRARELRETVLALDEISDIGRLLRLASG